MIVFWLGAVWIAGVAAGEISSLNAWQWSVLALLSILSLLLYRQYKPQRILFGLLLIFFLGAARLAMAAPSIGPSHLANYNDDQSVVVFEGTISAPPDQRDQYIGLRVRATEVFPTDSTYGRPAEGLVLVRAPLGEPWNYGDTVRLVSTLETPPEFETFSYREYLARRGVHSLASPHSIQRLSSGGGNLILRWLFAYRSQASRTIQRIYPEPEASLIAGITLGIEGQIPEQVRRAFDLTSTSHVIAISGSNMAIVAAIFLSLLGRWMGIRAGAVAAGVALAAYTLFVGAAAAVVRAALMAGLSLAALRLGRMSHALTSLMLTAVLMTLLQPFTLSDVGFQLSFAATLGLVLYAEPMKETFLRFARPRFGDKTAERMAGPVGEIFLFTFAAQLTTLPLTMYYFQRFPLVSVLANPAILPLQPPIMVLGGLSAILGSIWTVLGQPLAYVNWFFAASTIRIVEFFASLPFASLVLGRISFAAIVAYFVVLFGLTLLRGKSDRIPWQIKLPPAGRAAILATLLVLAGFIWRTTIDQPDGNLHISVLGTSDGEAILLQSPRGRHVLLQGGSSAIFLSDQLGRRLPLTMRSLDWLVIGSAADHDISAAPGILDRFPAANLWISQTSGGRAYDQILEIFHENGRPILQAHPGERLEISPGATLELVTMENTGTSYLLSYQDFRFLILVGTPGTILEPPVVRPQLSGPTVLLMPTRLLSHDDSAAFLTKLRPRLLLLTGESPIPPSEGSLLNIEHNSSLQTQANGWIELITNGENLWVEVERIPEAPGTH